MDIIHLMWIKSFVLEGKMWKPKENLNFGVDIYALWIYNSCINESHVCVYVHVRARI